MMGLCTPTPTFPPGTDLTGKSILITGAASGLGYQSVVSLLSHDRPPAVIFLTARTLAKAAAAVSTLPTTPTHPTKIIPLALDLTSFASIAALPPSLPPGSALDILLLNAGIMAVPPGLTADGYEIQFGTNHLGHALLTKLLLPLLQQSPAPRVVVLSSAGHRSWPQGWGLKPGSLRTDASELGAYERYFRSKLANVLFAREMARRYPGVKTVSVHPGIVDTGIVGSETPWVVTAAIKVFKPLVVRSVEDGVRNQLWACVSDDVVSGEYYHPVGVAGKASKDAKDDGLAAELWEWTEKELAVHGY
ncbi:short-chain dehydrogenase [Podospora conica]|nr:short-chain dehydrogenase [Schizothecium conicum]